MNRITPVLMTLMITLLPVIGCRATEAAGDSKTESNGNEAITNTTLNLLVDAHYTISHGWGHVFECRVRDVLSGELADSIIYVSVYGTAQLYGELLLPFQDYQDLIMIFEFNQNRQHGPPPGFKDSEGNYWELQMVQRLTALSVLPTLSEAIHGWRDFEGKASIFQFKSFPDIQHHHYRYPEPEKWVAGLKPGGTCDSTTGYVQVWAENGKVRFIWVTNPYPDGGRFYCFKGDTVDAATTVTPQGALFTTEVGIYKWRYIYKDGLLDIIVYYRYNVLSPIWAVDGVEYWPGTEVPKYIYRYEEPDGLNISGDNWDSRTVYDKEGKIVQREDSQGKVLWKKKVNK